nr:uncharacterized protein LOC105717546 [Aotus nancymaae]
MGTQFEADQKFRRPRLATSVWKALCPGKSLLHLLASVIKEAEFSCNSSRSLENSEGLRVAASILQTNASRQRGHSQGHMAGWVQSWPGSGFTLKTSSQNIGSALGS